MILLRAAVFSLLIALVAPGIARGDVQCSTVVSDIMFCDAEPVTLKPLMGSTWRLTFDFQGQSTNALISIEPVDRMRFALDVTRDSSAAFLTGVHKIQSNFWQVAHKNKSKTVSEIERHSGWPVLVTEFAPKRAWFKTAKGSRWHYTAAIVCNTAILIEQVEDDPKATEDMPLIANRILELVRPAAQPTADAKECLSDG
ncbi:MAG: hypothetical protein AAFO93_08755 [Pseudomonadota bacterium]